MVSQLEQVLGRTVLDVRPMAGGDICQAYLVSLENETRVFAKTRPGGPDAMFPAEAFGLNWLAETSTLKIPKVLAATKEFLVLEFLESGTKRLEFDEELGRGLAQLHQYPVSSPGLEINNFIGPLTQFNEPCGGWSQFYAEKRLAPQLSWALESGAAPSRWSEQFQTLYERLPMLIPEEPLSRLHGDLWGGNLLVGPAGEPCLIDPAVYVGHREVDLAMMRLFGGFSAQVFSAYQEAHPLESGWQQRVHLYQLYPLMVHVNLFGGGYISSVDRALEQLL